MPSVWVPSKTPQHPFSKRATHTVLLPQAFREKNIIHRNKCTLNTDALCSLGEQSKKGSGGGRDMEGGHGSTQPYPHISCRGYIMLLENEEISGPGAKHRDATQDAQVKRIPRNLLGRDVSLRHVSQKGGQRTPLHGRGRCE